jgi:hypothetical protein
MIAFLKAFDEVVDDVGDDGVEAGSGFVVEDDFGASDDGAGDADAFAHATGEVDGHFFCVGVEFDDFEGLLDAAFDFGGVFDASFDEGEGDVLGDGEAIEEGGVLEEVADAAAEGGELAFGEAAEGGAVELDGAGVGMEKADDVFEQDAFAFAGRADEDEGFAPADVEVDPLEDLLGVKAFVEAADLNERGRSGLRRGGCGHSLIR